MCDVVLQPVGTTVMRRTPLTVRSRIALDFTQVCRGGRARRLLWDSTYSALRWPPLRRWSTDGDDAVIAT